MLNKTLRSRYEITEKLGRGGFGQTYLARDNDLPGDHFCVVKHFSPQNRRIGKQNPLLLTFTTQGAGKRWHPYQRNKNL